MTAHRLKPTFDFNTYALIIKLVLSSNFVVNAFVHVSLNTTLKSERKRQFN